MTRQGSDGSRPVPRRVLQGSREPIFTVLPETVRANLYHPTSENALVWNALYPRLWPARRLVDLVRLRPLWGTPDIDFHDEPMRPYFWGYAVDGERLPGLDLTLSAVDGPGPKTEVDLFLSGEKELVLVEAKHTSRFGRCRRFAAGRCPLAHPQAEGAVDPCRYWDIAEARFSQDFRVVQPEPGASRPECHRHYQLARTLRVGRHLADSQGKRLHIWLVSTERAWARGLQADWLDFVDRLGDVSVWRRFRVVSWESIMALDPLEGPGPNRD